MSTHSRGFLGFIGRIGFSGAPLWILAVVVFGFANPALAATVGCNGAPSGSYDFTTLSAAISGASLTNNTITIYGTCTDDVLISGAQNLTIAGAPGSVLMDAGLIAVNAAGVLEIDNSQNVTIQNLKIQLSAYGIYGPFPAIVVNASSLVLLQIDIEGNTGTDGIDIGTLSNVQMVGNNLIENNNDGQGNGEGISLAGPAANLTIGRGPGAPSGCTVIQGSGDDGILAVSQASVSVTNASGCVTIQNNGSFGVQISQASTANLANNQGKPGVITLSGNQVGAYASTYAQLRLNGPMLIQNNNVAGVALLGATSVMNASGSGPLGPNITQNGANVNGNANLTPAGITLEGDSHLLVNAGQLSNNYAPGIVVQDDSNAQLNTVGVVSITQNPLGVSVTNSSTVWLTSAPSVTANANGDIVCGPFSIAHGDFSAVGHVSCDNLHPESGRPAGNGRFFGC